MKRAHGRYTDRHVARTSRFLGTLSRDLDKTFQTKVSGTWAAGTSGGDANYESDILNFVKEYKNDRLFCKIPGRQHSAFPGFVHHMSIDHPSKLKSRLKKYSRKLDMAREILPR